MLRLFLFVATILLSSPVFAKVSLPSIFSDHMVIQSNARIPVWGWANASEEITVSLGTQTQRTKADNKGKWKVILDSVPPGQQFTLLVRGNNTITIKDVLSGEVWLASGQSNMSMTLGEALSTDANIPLKNIPSASFPAIRIYMEISKASTKPQDLPHGEWKITDPENAGHFSAVAYFFAKETHQTLQVPVGVIVSATGGTSIETWMRDGTLKPIPGAEDMANKYLQYAQKHQSDFEKGTWPREHPPQNPLDVLPAGQFNSKIWPLIPYAIRGVLWYQGEDNAQPERSMLYHAQLKAMITDWRTLWNQGDFPFLMVQLPNFDKIQIIPVEKTSGWAMIREGIFRTLQLPNTGMAVTIDLGDGENIHPRNKSDVGKRLAMLALSKVYGQNILATGPLYKNKKIQGNTIEITFDYADDGLNSRNIPLMGFAIADDDKKWVEATATINGNKISVSSPDVKHPVAVRYAWADNPICNLFNSANLPASPFRTDDW